MKKLKGFTLVELIIVMFILAILMTAILQMFKPIRQTYVDSTLYESRRTAQNGVIQYITESIRYSTDLGMYTKDKVSNVTGAVDAFTKAYLEANGVSAADAANPSMYTATKDAIKKNAEVIIIDNTEDAYTFGNDPIDNTYTGRILRRKVDGTTSITNAAETAGSAECRLALGAAYYGESDFSITFGITQDASNEGKPDDGIKVTVASGAKSGLDDVAVISNNGLVLCKNHCSPINGMFDTVNYNSASASGANTKVYIVYINDKIDEDNIGIA